MEDIFDIVSKKISGTLISSDEQRLLDEWLLVPENVQLFHDYQKVWGLTSNLKLNLVPDVELEWQQFKSKLIQPQKSRKIFYYWSAAASIIILVGVLSIFKLNNLPATVYQSQNSLQKISLPDNSTVVLNKFSKLVVNNKFNRSNRSVLLDGEAYFEIKRDSLLPFEISANNGATVKVLGTRFNLKTNEKESNLDVFSGSVGFLKNNTEQWVIVKTGEQIKYNVAENIITPVATLNCNANSWNTGSFVFDNTPINEVALQLGEFIGKKLIIPTHTDHLRYSGTFQNPTDEQIAQVLALAMGWEYKISKQSVIFIIKEKPIQ